ncbi:MAG TPA: integron integrase [Pyrinomonadaceae bacterium]|jgi:integron integrase
MKNVNQVFELVRETTRQRALSRKTENAYLNHIRGFLEFRGNRNLFETEAEDILAFLRHLDADKRAAASTQNQARCALLFLYRDVFKRSLPPHFDEIKRARPPAKQPVVFTTEEVRAVLANLRDAPFLVAALIYGSGLRLPEAIALRVGDINFERREIVVRDARTGRRERTTVLPQLIISALKRHLIKVKFTYEDDCLSDFGKVHLPKAILRQFPEAASDWRWQYVFPAAKLTRDRDAFYRRHLAESTVQKAVSEAIEKAGIFKPGCCQSLRYSFAVRLFERNCNVHTIQNLLGHKNLKTTMSYLTSSGGGNRVFSPLDN